jgi:hypothetical protein
LNGVERSPWRIKYSLGRHEDLLLILVAIVPLWTITAVFKPASPRCAMYAVGLLVNPEIREAPARRHAVVGHGFDKRPVLANLTVCLDETKDTPERRAAFWSVAIKVIASTEL